MASERLEVRIRYEEELSRMLVDKPVLNSDYSLTAKIGELNLLANDLPTKRVLANNPRVTHPIKRRSVVTHARVTKKRSKTPLTTPQKRISRLQMLLTPPNTPEVERSVVYDMTQDDDEVVEIMSID